MPDIYDINASGTAVKVGTLHDVTAAGAATQISQVHDVTAAGTATLVFQRAFTAVDSFNWGSAYQVGVAPPYIHGSENGYTVIFTPQPSVGYTDDGNFGYAVSVVPGARYWVHVQGGRYGDSGGGLSIEAFGATRWSYTGDNRHSDGIFSASGSSTNIRIWTNGGEYSAIGQVDVIKVEELFALGKTSAQISSLMNSYCRGMSGSRSVVLA